MRRREFLKATASVTSAAMLAGCSSRGQTIDEALEGSSVFKDVRIEDTVLHVTFEESPEVHEEICNYDPILEITTCDSYTREVEITKWGVSFPDTNEFDWTEGVNSSEVSFDFGSAESGDFTIGAYAEQDSLMGISGWTEFYFSTDYSGGDFFIVEESSGYHETF